MHHVFIQIAEMKLDDGTPVSTKLGRFMVTSLRIRIPKRTMLLLYNAIRDTDLNLPTAEEFFKDLKNAGFTYPTWFKGD